MTDPDTTTARLQRIRLVLIDGADVAPGGNCAYCDHAGMHATWCPLPGALADVEALLAEVDERAIAMADLRLQLRGAQDGEAMYRKAFLEVAAERDEARRALKRCEEEAAIAAEAAEQAPHLREGAAS